MAKSELVKDLVRTRHLERTAVYRQIGRMAATGLLVESEGNLIVASNAASEVSSLLPTVVEATIDNRQQRGRDLSPMLSSPYRGDDNSDNAESEVREGRCGGES